MASNSFTAVGNGTAIQGIQGQQITYDVSGTFVGTVVLKRSQDNWATSENGGQGGEGLTVTEAASGTIDVLRASGAQYQYRWVCTAYTSGTIVAVVSESASEVASSLNDQDGVQRVAATQSGGVVTGTLSVSGATTHTGAVTNSSTTTTTGIATHTAALVSPVTVQALAAAGSAQGDAGAVTATSPGFVHATAADGTKGIVLPAATAGKVIHIKNSDAANAVLKVYPASGDAINAIAADAAISMAAKTSATFVALDATTWYTIPLLPS